MGKLLPISTKLASAAEKATKTRLEIMEITAALLETWKAPPFQRPLRANAKVVALAEEIKTSGVIPGIITLGTFNGVVYILDGQHRLHAFRLSGCESVYADVRVSHFASFGEMGEEFVALNSSLVRLRPDDILRGLEGCTAPVAHIRKRCPFVGYDMIRRGPHSPIVSMSVVLRCWRGSEPEVPAGACGSAHHVATTLLMEDAEQLATFVELAYASWGRDPEYIRLWGTLNLTLCMWLYRRMVLGAYSHKTIKLTRAAFGKGLMSLSASPEYLDWLGGRALRDSDRSPGYGRLKAIMAARFTAEMGRKIMLPQPPWASHVTMRVGVGR